MRTRQTGFWDPIILIQRDLTCQIRTSRIISTEVFLPRRQINRNLPKAIWKINWRMCLLRMTWLIPQKLHWIFRTMTVHWFRGCRKVLPAFRLPWMVLWIRIRRIRWRALWQPPLEMIRQTKLPFWIRRHPKSCFREQTRMMMPRLFPTVWTSKTALRIPWSMVSRM